MGETVGLKPPQETRHGARSRGGRAQVTCRGHLPGHPGLRARYLPQQGPSGTFPWTSPHPCHRPHLTLPPPHQPRGLRAGPGTDRGIVTIPAPFGKKRENLGVLCPALNKAIGYAQPGAGGSHPPSPGTPGWFTGRARGLGCPCPVPAEEQRGAASTETPSLPPEPPGRAAELTQQHQERQHRLPARSHPGDGDTELGEAPP